MKNKSKSAIKAAQKRSARAKKTKDHARQERAQKNTSNRERNIAWDKEMPPFPSGQMAAPFGFFGVLKQYQPLKDVANMAAKAELWENMLSAAKVSLDLDRNVVGISFWRNTQGDETIMGETSLPKNGETNFMSREQILAATECLSTQHAI